MYIQSLISFLKPLFQVQTKRYFSLVNLCNASFGILTHPNIILFARVYSCDHSSTKIYYFLGSLLMTNLEIQYLNTHSPFKMETHSYAKFTFLRN